MDAVKFVHEQLNSNTDSYGFSVGDTVVVSYRIIEGDKQRIQDFRGDVIQIKGEGVTKTFTVRRIASGVGVERIFPMASPNIAGLKILKRGKVRRAKLYYLRGLTGKKARIKERKQISK